MIKDPEKQARVGEVLHHLLEAVRTLSRLLAPFMPAMARELSALLALSDDALRVPWGQGFVAGHKVNPAKILFPRIETDAKK
jgi:methionyl-tRNA synthetase